MAIYESDNKIYVTRDYELFKNILGNRDVTQKRAGTIRNKIQEYGWLPVPILVNENYEIIDGQGRFEALRSLEMPIEFTIKKGIGMPEVIALNCETSTWKMMDYIDSFANRGFREYITLRQLTDKYMVDGGVINLRSILTVLNIVDKSSPDGATAEKQIREGKYHLKESTAMLGDIILTWIRKHADTVKLISAPRRQQLVRALSFAYLCSSAQHEQLEKAMLRMEADGKRIGADNLNECLDIVSDAYNKRLPSGVRRLYLRPEYDTWLIHGTKHLPDDIKRLLDINEEENK